jgi:hypothetical protein
MSTAIVSNDRLQQAISVCELRPGAPVRVTRDITIGEALEEITTGRFAAEVAEVRRLVAIHGKDSEQVKAAKLRLPAHLFSGQVNGAVAQAMQQGRMAHAGVLQLDFDGIEDAEFFRDELANDPHVIAAWVSPSGNGVKGLCAIEHATTEEQHKAAFLAAESYFAGEGLELDKACKNSNRLCFASFDPDARIRSGPARVLRQAPPQAAKPTQPPLVLSAHSRPFPEPPAHGVHQWLAQAARWCEQAGLSEVEAVAKLREQEPRLRRRYSHRECEDAARLVYDTPSGSRPAVENLNGRPAIELPCPGRPLSDFAAEVGAMLAGRGVYSRGGLAFTVDHATKQLAAVDPQWLRTWAEREVSLFKHAKNAAGLAITLRHSMSLDTARALVVAPQFLEPLPEIRRFAPVRMPTMRADGRIELLPLGFDEETRTLTDPNGCQLLEGFDDVPAEMGAKAIRAALAEFPFADERSKAAAVSAMFTVYAGGLLPPASTMPAFVYMANAEGSGKTTLAQLAGIPYGVCEAESKPNSEDEWQKALLALVMSGSRLLLLDNLKGHLNSPSFEAFLTATKFSGRILGVNKKFSGEADATVLLTGNRLTVSPDLRRRCIFIELFMQELRAEDRVFKRRLDPPAILEMQPQLLMAMWAIIKGWDAAGRPPASKINASVPRWSEIIAGIVEWAGWSCPSAPAELEDGGDTDTRDIGRLGEAMPLDRPMKFSELCELCEELGLFERFIAWMDDSDKGREMRRKFSAVLKTYAGRTIAPGKRFLSEGKSHSRRYAVK